MFVFEEVLKVFSRIVDPSKNHDKTIFRTSLEPQGLRDPPCAKAQHSAQDSPNESSVRPNGTPVMPILRSRKNSEVSQFVFADFWGQYGAEIWAPRRQQPATGQTATQRFRFPAGGARTITIATPQMIPARGPQTVCWTTGYWELA